jgi:(p)ppGpp synthase/HD superfamily hydrolase
MPGLERAIELAHYAHEGQFRFNGDEYVTHPLGVMEIARLLGHSEATQICAVLHDAPEDSEGRVTVESLEEEGYGPEIITPLDLLTKAPGEDYDLYVARLVTNPRSRIVKKIDLFKNMDLTGIENPTRKQILNVEKYGRAAVYIARFPQPIT